MPRRLLLAVLVAALAPASAHAAGGIPDLPPGVKLPNLPKLTQWRGTISVAGYSEATTVYDSTSPCAPGESWNGEQKTSFELTKPMAIRINIQGKVIASEPLTTSNDAIQTTTTYSNYRTTEHCDDRPRDDSAYVEPADTCPAKQTGRMVFGIAGAPKLQNSVADDLDDLAPLSHQAGLVIGRASKTWLDPNKCPGFGTFEPRSGDAKAGTMAVAGSPGIDLPLDGIGTAELRNQRVGRTLRSEVTAGGACGTFLVNVSPLIAKAAFVEDCTLKTRIVVTLKRTG